MITFLLICAHTKHSYLRHVIKSTHVELSELLVTHPTANALLAQKIILHHPRNSLWKN